MSEIVVDERTGEITLVVEQRKLRPNEFRDGRAERCPFCPGNEDETPPEIAAYRDDAGAWSVRAFRNKFPALEPPAGDHEVIVDTPGHENEITGGGVCMWRDRYLAALERFPDAAPALFKNSGALSGATIAHPHTQLLVLCTPVPRWQTMRANGERYAASNGTCAWCDEVRDARERGLIVDESEHFVAYVRDASRFSDTLTVVPVACAPSVHTMTDAECDDLAAMLTAAVEAAREGLPANGAFNLIIPSDARAERGTFHWQLELIPRAGTLAGLELGTGISIKSVTAQESAARWRRMLRARGSV